MQTKLCVDVRADYVSAFSYVVVVTAYIFSFGLIVFAVFFTQL